MEACGVTSILPILFYDDDVSVTDTKMVPVETKL
jgi:hypothetical protein